MPSWIEASMAGICSATPLVKTTASATTAAAHEQQDAPTANARGMKRSSQLVSGSVMTARTSAAPIGTMSPLIAR